MEKADLKEVLLNNVCFWLQVCMNEWKETKTSKIHGKTTYVIIDLAISCSPLNTWASRNFLPSIKYISSYCPELDMIYLIQQSLQLTSVPLSNTSRKYFINFKHAKHAILWSSPSRPSMTFYETCQACHFIRHTKYVGTPSSYSMQTRQACKHIKHSKYVKHGSMPSTQTHQALQACKACENASMPFSRISSYYTLTS